MDPEEAKLFNEFINESKKSRSAFLEMLENKYVKNQSESDVINIRSLELDEDRGSLRRKKTLVPFGYLTSYTCRKGRKVMKILRRRIKLKKRCHVIEYGDGNADLSVSHCIEVIDLCQSDSEQTKCASTTDSEPLPSKTVKFIDDAIEKQIFTNFNLPIDPLHHSKSPFRFKCQPPPYRKRVIGLPLEQLPLRLKHFPFSLNEIPICDLSLSFISDDDNEEKQPRTLQNSFRPQQRNKASLKQQSKKSHEFCIELEENVDITDEYDPDGLLKRHKKSAFKSASLFASFYPKDPVNERNSVAPLCINSDSSQKRNSLMPIKQISCNFSPVQNIIRPLPCPITPKFSKFSPKPVFKY